MAYRNDYCPVWETITPSDTAPQNYYGIMCLTAGNIVWKSEATGADITNAMTANQTIIGRVVLVKTTGTSGTYAGAKAS